MMKTILFLLFSVFVSARAAEERSVFELRTAPIMFYAKWLTIDATYLINDHWAAGPSYVAYEDNSKYANMFMPSYYGRAIGGHAIWAVESLYENSWYVGSHVYYEDYRARGHAAPIGDEDFVTGYRANAVLGFRQFNGSFLTMVGLGYETRKHKVEKIKSGISTNSDENLSWFHAEFKVGWLF